MNVKGWYYKHFKNKTWPALIVFLFVFILSALILTSFGTYNVFISEIIQLWTIITTYFVLYTQFFREKKGFRKRLEYVINKIEFIARLINKNRELFDKIEVNNKEFEILRSLIQEEIFLLQRWNMDELIHLKCEILSTKLGVLKVIGNYLIGYEGIGEIKKNGKIINISNNVKKINEIILELRKMI